MRKTRAELFRYLANGALATAVHFAVLVLNVEILAFSSIGAANFIAAIFGSAAAFIGNRYFVFRALEASVGQHLVKFTGLYLLMASFHGVALFIWTDLCHWSYTLGFLVATSIQITLGFLGNKLWVFRS